MFGIGPWEMIVIIGIILVLFGPSKLPEMGKALGTGIKEFKKGATSMKEGITSEVETVTDNKPNPDSTATQRPQTNAD